MNWSWEAIVALGVPVVGWVISVERRLANVRSIKEQVDRIEKKTDMLISHLIDFEN